MKQNYKAKTFFKEIPTRLNKAYLFFLLVTVIGTLNINSQSYTFTPAGAVGRIGPTQLQLNTAYFGSNLQGMVVSTAGIQSWTVPVAGSYRVYARGAQGAGANGGMGAVMEGDFTFAANDVIRIVVGQLGETQTGEPNACAGGGGSFVMRGTGNLVTNILVIAGGGGGSPATYSISRHASTGTSGNWGAGGNNTDGSPGTNGNGGNKSVAANDQDRGAGGGGFFTDGQSIQQTSFLGAAQGGTAFVNGCEGGSHNTTGAEGGFGGGGAVWTTGYRAGGGGGGYSGGGGGQTNTNTNTQCGGGGGSYNAGTNQNNSLSTITGDGRVIITALCNISLTNASTNGPGPICSGGSATLTTNAVSNYVWSNGGTTSSIVVSPTVTTSYTLTATSSANCTASSIITVTVQNTPPTVTAAASNAAVCAGVPVTLTGGGADTYTWTGGATNATPFTPLATSGYTVTGANACGTATAAVSVTVNTSPVVTASANTPTVCSGNPVILTYTGNATTTTWSGGVQTGVPFVPGATANYTLTGTANGCSSITVVGVTVLVTPNSPPVVTPTAICLGGTATLSAIGAAGYTWTPGSNLFTASLTVSPQVPTTYTVVRNNGACSSTMTIGLVVNPLPLVNATASPSQICAGTGVNLVVVGPISNVWLPGGFTQGNFTVYPNFSTNYTVTGSNGNCTASVVVPVIVNPTPTLSILSSTNTICQGQNVTLTGVGGLTYTWFPSTSTNTVEVASPNATSLFTLTGANSFNCTSSITQVVVVNPLPNMALVSNIPFLCVGNTASISVANQASNVVYNWNTGPVGPSISVSPIVTTSYTATGTNTITGCQNTNTISLAVYISTFVVSSPTAICKGQTATLSAAGDATSYSWTANGTPIGTSVSSVTVSPVISTNYTVTGSNGSCQSQVGVNLIVHQLPNVTASVAKSQICKFEIATITGGGATTYTWDTGSGLSNLQTLTFTLSVTTTYTLTGTDNNGCSKTTTVTQFVATCIGLEDQQTNGNAGITVYPNPNNGNFMISSDVNITLSIVNALGQVVDTLKISEDNRKEVTVGNLPTGIYFITGQTNGKKVNKKIIVER